MLETLVWIANCVQDVVCGGIFYSYKTGHFLVTLVKTIFGYIYTCLDSLLKFSIIFGESLSIFGQDIAQFLQNVLFGLVSGVEFISTTISSAYLTTASFITLIGRLITGFCSAISTTVVFLCNGFVQAFVFARKLILLAGSGVWFAVTLLPLLLLYLCTLLARFVVQVVEETRQIILSGFAAAKTLSFNVITFVTDVPFESLAGLIVLVCICYVLTQFYVIISRGLKQLMRKLQTRLRRRTRAAAVTQSRHIRYVYRRRTADDVDQVVRRRPAISRPRIGEADEISDDKACVICQERSKCILLLPCRHVCLCSQCNAELRYYNNACPVCRTDIESTMKIFV